eukprot:gene14275-biopygen2760
MLWRPSGPSSEANEPGGAWFLSWPKAAHPHLLRRRVSTSRRRAGHVTPLSRPRSPGEGGSRSLPGNLRDSKKTISHTALETGPSQQQPPIASYLHLHLDIRLPPESDPCARIRTQAESAAAKGEVTDRATAEADAVTEVVGGRLPFSDGWPRVGTGSARTPQPRAAAGMEAWAEAESKAEAEAGGAGGGRFPFRTGGRGRGPARWGRVQQQPPIRAEKRGHPNNNLP